MKTPRDKIKDALGIKDEEDEEQEVIPQNAKEILEEDEAEELEDDEDVDLDDEETETATEVKKSPRPIKEEVSPKKAGRPRKNKLEVVTSTAKEIPITKTPMSNTNSPSTDVWLNWLDRNLIVTPADVVVYSRNDGGKVIVCLDASGKKTVLNCGIHLTKDLLDKLAPA